MLPFQVDILRKLTSKAPDADGLVILARGLGLRSIVCDMLKVYDEKENLVLLINATEEEERGIGEEIGMKLKAIGFEMPAKDRKAVYLAGGIVSVTSRILVVDMLNSVVPVSHITGLVVLQAEK
jgi:DNA excision repair protein ERCC-4